MDGTMGFCLLRGRAGAAGHVRALGDGKTVSARGLRPGESYTLYLLADGRAQPWEKKAADPAGCAVFSDVPAGTAFLASGGRVVLWEDGENADQTYLTACACLKRLNAPPTPVPEPPREEPALPMEEQGEETEGAVTPVGEDSRDEAGPEPLVEEKPADERMEKETHTLRPPGGGEPVDALPALIWPVGTEQTRAWFEERPPMAPFHAPGWRFVRIPSHVPGAAYCVAGRYARDTRVTHILHAVPGGPHRPPDFLPGYRYRPGRDGGGYWITVQEAGL